MTETRYRTPIRVERNAGAWEYHDLLHSYGAVIGLSLCVAALGQLGLALARPIFILGCFAAANFAYRKGGLGSHVEASITLFVFAPFLRRIVDLHAGFDASSVMLVGPLLATMAAFPELRRLLFDRLPRPALFVPYLLICLCVTYGWILSAFQDNMLPASIAAAKHIVPMLYCVCLMLRPDQSGPVIRSAARAFLVVSPIIGIYGIAQHVAPLAWDKYWMVSSKMLSIGEPEPGKVRVFSTMNSPASFAFYAICSLLFSSFSSTVISALLVPIVAVLPLAVALLLSGVRTAWIAAIVALIFCALFRQTRKRAGLLGSYLAAGLVITLLYTSFGSTVADRLGTLTGGVSHDGSGQDRVHDYLYVFTEGSRYLFGVGLTGSADPLLAAADGQLLASVTQLGLVVGTLHTALIIWAGLQAVLAIRGQPGMLPIIAGAVVAGNMSIFLLLDFTEGEMGFLFWMLVGTLSRSTAPHADGRP